MSEFKFACPVCAQHITADSSNTGEQIECPTCFQKIIIPKAPAAHDSKFIFSAAKAGDRRGRPANGGIRSDAPLRTRGRRSVPGAAVLLLIVAAAGALFLFRDRVFKPNEHAHASTNAAASAASTLAAREIPPGLKWTLNLSEMKFPDTRAAGRIHGGNFVYDRASLQGGTLSLRQGRTWPPDLGLTIQFFAREGEELSGKTIEITPQRTPPQPRVTLRWKDDQQQAITRQINTGYALRIVFGKAADGRMPGHLYICLPDEANSFVAGTFDAEIRRRPPPKPSQ